MLRRLCSSSSWGALNTVETAAVAQLCASHRRLHRCGGLAGIADEDASAVCAEVLKDIDKAARAFCLEVAPRHYREKFSANYRALFPDSGRLYRVDVLETSLDRHSAIWVNGEKFELSPEALEHAEALQRAWIELGTLLDRWQVAQQLQQQQQQQQQHQHLDVAGLPAAPLVASAELTAPSAAAAQCASRAELVAALKALDIAWAAFERSYIMELIEIERKARQLVVRAESCDNRLRALPKHASAGERRAIERELVQLLGHMNSVANFKCKGRDDLGYEILESARDVYRRCERSGRADALTGAARDAAKVLADDVIISYDALRHYLRSVGKSKIIERVDPHLCNNTGLVARLVDWETSWEIGARYVHERPLLEALCDLVSEIKSAQALAPQLEGMFEDCDVELFMVLPRVIMLFFAAGPMKPRAELVHSLLPHRFRPSTPSSAAGVPPSAAALSPELRALSEQYDRALRALAQAVEPSAPSADAAWRLLVQRAVLGTFSEADDAYRRLPPAALQVFEDLMRELEKWSLELQRHCPQDWNQCSAVLVQCVTGRSKRRHNASSTFQV